jgi:hypothetical protein
VTRGYLDLAGFTDTPTWWLGFRLRLRAMQDDAAAKVLEEQGRFADPEGFAAWATRYRPWAPYSGGAEDVDLVARWYIVNAPDLLRTAGVPLP